MIGKIKLEDAGRGQVLNCVEATDLFLAVEEVAIPLGLGLVAAV